MELLGAVVATISFSELQMALKQGMWWTARRTRSRSFTPTSSMKCRSISRSRDTTYVGLDNASLLTMLPQRMYASTTGFVLLAVPFFILAGNLMNTGGVTNRIFGFARGLVGHISDGLGQVCISGECLVSGISGPALMANAATCPERSGRASKK